MILNASGQGGTDNRIVLLWENPDVTKEFASQSIELGYYTNINAIVKYKAFYVAVLSSTTGDVIHTTPILADNSLGEQVIYVYDSNYICYRSVNFTVNEIGTNIEKHDLSFTVGMRYANNGYVSDNKVAIPYRIYGVL